MKKNIHMIGNAHLDPIWLWNWQEGYSETKATFRSALDRMKEFPEFTFTCAGTLAYSWIEECCPDMFAEIKERVKEGRWIPVGGFLVQPDCNLPCGESLSRHILYGQRYFKEKFGITAKVGYNVDSFGHNGMLPQILKKGGMDYYVFMRPMNNEKQLPENLFWWQSPDGSRVLTYRIPGGYCANFNDMETFDNHIDNVIHECGQKAQNIMCFYGVGNHGGGPTIKNLQFLEEMKKSKDKREIIFSHPEHFFRQALEEKREFQTVADDLQHHASGCYSALSAIKKMNRQCETKLQAAEKYSVLASVLVNLDYPAERLKKAWENVLFNQFHDSLGGCGIKTAYQDIFSFAEESLSVAAKTQNLALQCLSYHIDTASCGSGSKIVVFNPHPWQQKAAIAVNTVSLCFAQNPLPARFRALRVFDNKGNSVPIQEISAESNLVFPHHDILFLAELPAFGYRVFTIRDDEDQQTKSSLKISENSLENDFLKIQFDRESGAVSSIYDKKKELEILSGRGLIPVVLDESGIDTWAHGVNTFNREIGAFSDASITVLEQGPLRVILKVESRFRKSMLTQYFTLYSHSDRLYVSAKADWHEKKKQLRISCGLNLTDTKHICEIPFGIIGKDASGEEQPGQEWTALSGKCEGRSVTAVLLNDSKYSFSATENVLSMTVLRSPVYADHGNGTLSSEAEYMDQGISEFSYGFVSFENCEFSDITKAAREMNNSPTYVFEASHQGSLPAEYCGFNIDQKNIMISAIKQAEDANGYIVRCYETEGKSAVVTISMPFAETEIHVLFKPFELKTLYIYHDGNWKEVLLTELENNEN